MANQTNPSAPNSSPQPEKPKEKTGFTEKFKSSLDKFRTNEQMEHLVGYATSNTRDTVSYVLLIIGIVLLFFYPFYGGILVGLIAGFYYSSEVLALFQSFNEFLDDQGIVKSLILGGLFLALFISAPAIFIGIAIAVAIRQILFPESQKK